LLWRHLRRKQLHGLKFRRQEQIGRFIADFVCYEHALIIEADGGQHAVEKEKDLKRTAWLNSQGFTVLRFWNNEILSNTEGVLEVIFKACTPPLSDPLPPREEGASSANPPLSVSASPACSKPSSCVPNLT